MAWSVQLPSRIVSKWMHLMAKRPLSLRKHLIWILLVKLVVIVLLRVTLDRKSVV